MCENVSTEQLGGFGVDVFFFNYIIGNECHSFCCGRDKIIEHEYGFVDVFFVKALLEPSVVFVEKT